MAILEHLEPKAVFGFFEAISAIPRGSGNTRAISDHLARFAAERGLEHIQDDSGNVVVFAPASPGYEGAEPVILQGHMDMVCEKDADCDLDMEREGVRLAVDGDVVYAEGSTLGGDDGAAVAMLMAILDDKSLPHPPLECVFTVDEEIGMLGAAALDVECLKGRRMLNLDSEDEGIFTASCAGGRVVTARLPLRREAQGGATLRLTVSGLTGGHSGVEIDRGRANSSQLLGRLLSAVARATMLRVVSVEGGKKDNAIPVLSEAIIRVASPAAAEAACRDLETALKEEFALSDPGLRVSLAPAETALLPFDAPGTAKLITLLLCLPGGVQAMSQDVPGLVQTSLNLGILETVGDAVVSQLSVRSSLESGKAMLTDRIERLLRSLGGSISVEGDYPGWAFRRESPLRELLCQVYREQYGREPVVNAIHAGLECGLFSGKLPGLDCVSIGPDLEEIHTPREKMHIASVARTWALVTETLKRMR